MGLTYLVRREHFSACHRLHSQQLSPEENVEIFGPCNNPNGHGHNYYLEVTVAGEVSPTTGMVMNLTTLKGIIKVAVLDKVDHKNLDLDVNYFRDNRIVTTTENVAKFVWDQIQLEFEKCQNAESAKLFEIKIWETEKNMVIYRG